MAQKLTNDDVTSLCCKGLLRIKNGWELSENGSPIRGKTPLLTHSARVGNIEGSYFTIFSSEKGTIRIVALMLCHKGNSSASYPSLAGLTPS